MNDLLFNILEVVIISAIAAVLRYVIPYFTRLLREHDYSFAADIVEKLVRSAEQTITGVHRGEEKFEWVIRMAKAQFDKYSINVDDAQLIQLLEAAVLTINTEGSVICVPIDKMIEKGTEAQAEEDEEENEPAKP